MGRGGIYYRKTLSPSRSSHEHSASDDNSGVALVPNALRGVGPMIEIESGDITAMVDSSSADLLQELNEKKQKIRIAPIVVVLAILSAIWQKRLFFFMPSMRCWNALTAHFMKQQHSSLTVPVAGTLLRQARFTRKNITPALRA